MVDKLKKLETLFSGIKLYIEELRDAMVALKRVIEEVENTLEDIRHANTKQQGPQEDCNCGKTDEDV